MEIFLGILAAVLAGALIFLVVRQRDARSDGQTALLVQQGIDSLRADMDRSLRTTAERVSSEVRDMRALVFSEMGKTTSSVNDQTKLLMDQMGKLNLGIGDRLNSAAEALGNVQRGLGELGKATEQLKELGGSVVELQQILKAPKSRGSFGELLLEDLLKQVIPRENFEMQHKFKGGQVVDAIVRTSGGTVPVDSKFPMENFQRMAAAATEEEAHQYRKSFSGDVKKHIDAIASKYINTDEGTFDFALMYIPAENVYYEAVIRQEAEDNGIYQYAIDKRVVPVSPNTLYAHLRVIALGLKGMQIEKNAQEILGALKQLEGELAKFEESFGTIGVHLENARKKYEEAEKRLARFVDRLDRLAAAGESNEAAPQILPANET